MPIINFEKWCCENVESVMITEESDNNNNPTHTLRSVRIFHCLVEGATLDISSKEEAAQLIKALEMSIAVGWIE